MSLRRGNTALAGAAMALALVASGCGGDDEPRGIPQRDAQLLLQELQSTQNRVNAQACTDVKQGNLVRMERTVDNLPDQVGTNLQTALAQSVDNLQQLVEDDCRPEPEPEPEPVPTETTPAPTTTEEQPTTTEEEPQPEPEPDENKGNENNGGASPNGNGNNNNNNGRGRGNNGRATPGGGAEPGSNRGGDGKQAPRDLEQAQQVQRGSSVEPTNEARR
jgi:hypothetical protein